MCVCVKVAVKAVWLSAASTAGGLQRAVESALEKKQGKTFGGAGGRALTLLLDDVALPDYSATGHHYTSELLRQLVSDKGFYNLDKAGEWKTVKDCRCLATMPSPGPARNDLPARLKRHWLTLAVPMPGRAALEAAFGPVVRGHLAEQGAGPELAGAGVKAVEATVQVWQRLQQLAAPAFATFYYGYTLRDLVRAVEGLTRAGAERAESREQLLRLWAHECQRALLDKLAAPAEVAQGQAVIAQALEEGFGPKLAAKVAQHRALFAPWTRDDNDDNDDDDDDDGDEEEGEEVGAGRGTAGYRMWLQPRKLAERVEELRRRPGAGRAGKDMILFPQAVEQLAAIARLLALPGGHCVLLGPQGAGKQALARLAAALAGQETVQVGRGRGQQPEELREELRRASRTAGAAGRHVTVLVCGEEQEGEEGWAVLNEVLLTGEAPGLWSREDMDALLAASSLRSSAPQVATHTRHAERRD